VRFVVLNQGEIAKGRRFNHPIGYFSTIMARGNTFMNALIYMIQYDVVRLALKNFAQKTAAKMRKLKSATNTTVYIWNLIDCENI